MKVYDTLRTFSCRGQQRGMFSAEPVGTLVPEAKASSCIEAGCRKYNKIALFFGNVETEETFCNPRFTIVVLLQTRLERFQRQAFQPCAHVDRSLLILPFRMHQWLDHHIACQGLGKEPSPT